MEAEDPPILGQMRALVEDDGVYLHAGDIHDAVRRMQSVAAGAAEMEMLNAVLALLGQVSALAEA